MRSFDEQVYRDMHIAWVANLIGIKPATLERYIREGKYPDVKIPEGLNEKAIISHDN